MMNLTMLVIFNLLALVIPFPAGETDRSCGITDQILSTRQFQCIITKTRQNRSKKLQQFREMLQTVQTYDSM